MKSGKNHARRQNKIKILGFRVTEGTRKKLERATRNSGRSMSAEIEFRLAKTFDYGEFYRWICEEENGGMGLK